MPVLESRIWNRPYNILGFNLCFTELSVGFYFILFYLIILNNLVFLILPE